MEVTVGGNETHKRNSVVSFEGNSVKKYRTFCTEMKTVAGVVKSHTPVLGWSLFGMCD